MNFVFLWDEYFTGKLIKTFSLQSMTLNKVVTIPFELGVIFSFRYSSMLLGKNTFRGLFLKKKQEMS